MFISRDDKIYMEIGDQGGDQGDNRPLDRPLDRLGMPKT